MADFDVPEFLDLVYGAAVDPQLWAPAMARFADAVGGVHGWLSLLDLKDGSGGGMISRIDPLMLDRYVEYYAYCNPLFLVDDPDAFVREWRPRILTDEDWMPKSELLKTEYYNDFLVPQDIHSGMMVRLDLRGTRTATLNIGRPKSRGGFERADVELARRLHPHLIRAFELSQKLAFERQLDVAGGLVFDASDHALFLLDRRARVQRMNPAAERLLIAGRGLVLAGGRLTAARVADARRLSALFARAVAEDPAARSGVAMPLRLAEGGPALSITAAPVGPSTAPLLEEPAAMIVCVTDPETRATLPEDRLRDLFGLTRTEAKVALALFHGATPREAADQLGVSPNTVQNHLARVFEKTGANRQSRLVRLIARLAAAPLDGDGRAAF